MSRQCSCGGIVRQHGLTNNREAWTCGACGRYEIIQRNCDEQIEREEDDCDSDDAGR